MYLITTFHMYSCCFESYFAELQLSTDILFLQASGDGNYFGEYECQNI